MVKGSVILKSKWSLSQVRFQAKKWLWKQRMSKQNMQKVRLEKLESAPSIEWNRHAQYTKSAADVSFSIWRMSSS